MLHEGKSLGRTADVQSDLEAGALLFGLAFRGRENQC